MSATLAVLLQRLEPTWRIHIVEALDDVGLESSNPWNNAGTGHSALCELNYTPARPDGSVDVSKAILVNEQFQMSRQFWAHLVETGLLAEPSTFINSTPHIAFVAGRSNVEYMRRRFEALRPHPLFSGLSYSEERSQLGRWAPMLTTGRRRDEAIAATYSEAGSDVDFGALTRQLIAHLQSTGATLATGSRVSGLRREADGWTIRVKQTGSRTQRTLRTGFVFVGAGGGALSLLQKSGIPEIRGYGGFPVSGEFLRTDDPDLVVKHAAKVYGKASVGAPPMSVPHLDARIVDGNQSLMFGPYAGFSPKFLKHGSLLDLLRSIRSHNLWPLLNVAVRNLDLVRYLVGQLTATPARRFEALREFVPSATTADWHRIVAGQRVQVIRPDRKKGGTLQFGTEVIASRDGSIAGLLGASPGASTAVPIMLDLLRRSFPQRWESWSAAVSTMVPTYGYSLNHDAALADATLSRTARILGLHHTPIPANQTHLRHDPVTKNPPVASDGRVLRCSGTPTRPAFRRSRLHA